MVRFCSNPDNSNKVRYLAPHGYINFKIFLSLTKFESCDRGNGRRPIKKNGKDRVSVVA